MNQQTRSSLQPLNPNYMVYQEDEINLVDLYIALLKYRKVFMTVFLLLLVLGSIFVLFNFQEKYSLSSTLQIGGYEKDSNIFLLEETESVISKINNAILPENYRRWMDEHQDIPKFKTDISIPKGSNTVVIKNKITQDQKEQITSFQNGLTHAVIESHQRLLNSFQANLKASMELKKLQLMDLENPLTLQLRLKSGELKLDAEIIKLAKLEDGIFLETRIKEFKNKILLAEHNKERLNNKLKVLDEKLKRIQGKKDLLAKNISEVRKQIAGSNSIVKTSIKGATDISAMSQLLINNELQQYQTRLLNLEQQFFTSVEDERSDILEKIEGNKLALIDSQKTINVLEQKYKKMLVENELQLDLQKIAVEKVKLDIQSINQDHSRKILEIKQQIKEVSTKLKNYNETRVVSAPVLSIEAVGLSRNFLILIVIFMAGFAGFSAMLVAMFRDKVNERLQETA